jgi:hypothetical protein
MRLHQVKKASEIKGKKFSELREWKNIFARYYSDNCI